MFSSEIDFGHSFVEFRQVEKRIVAEAPLTARRGKNFPGDAAFGGEPALAIAGGDENTAVAGVALAGRHVLQEGQEEKVVALVRIRICGSYKPSVCGVTGGADSRFAVECVDFSPESSAITIAPGRNRL